MRDLLNVPRLRSVAIATKPSFFGIAADIFSFCASVSVVKNYFAISSKLRALSQP